jgi:hypothetical protein
MAVEIVTKEDLEAFRINLLTDIRLLLANSSTNHSKPWLRGMEVRKLLHISDGTLQHLRISGKLPSSKVGGMHYYRYEDIEKMMDGSFYKK